MAGRTETRHRCQAGASGTRRDRCYGTGAVRDPGPGNRPRGPKGRRGILRNRLVVEREDRRPVTVGILAARSGDLDLPGGVRGVRPSCLDSRWLETAAEAPIGEAARTHSVTTEMPGVPFRGSRAFCMFAWDAWSSKSRCLAIRLHQEFVILSNVKDPTRSAHVEFRFRHGSYPVAGFLRSRRDRSSVTPLRVGFFASLRMALFLVPARML
jgi:hypothetical protein